MKRPVEFGTVIEYNAEGNVAWSWRSSTYCKGSPDLMYYSSATGRPALDVHENAFFFDEKAKAVYIEFPRDQQRRIY